MEKIIIRFHGTEKNGYKIGYLSLHIPFNNPDYYAIVKETDIVNYNNVECKKTVEDKKNNVLYCFCIADGEPVVFIREGGYKFNEVSNFYSLEGI